MSSPSVFAQASTSIADAIRRHPQDMPKDLFYAASLASGFWYCDRDLQNRQAHFFDRRYGARVMRLAAIIEHREGLGWSERDVIVTVCSRRTESQRVKDFRDFGTQLTVLEKRYLKGN
jgi:hypothetical protein